MLETPVAFIIFNRPDTTRRVFKEIARAKPKRLLVIADGPRPDRPEDVAKCAEARAIIEQVDWDCEVWKNYSDSNLGCKIRVTSGLNWVFEIFENAIILEDDCLPDQSFFRFCSELLERYEKDERIMMVSGDNFISKGESYEYSYYYGYCFHIWGWATWRRAWRHYDINIAHWNEMRSTPWLNEILHDKPMITYWQHLFDDTAAGNIDTWDYQWFFTCWKHNGLAIIPSTNLITNIGFGNDATHTKTYIDTMANLSINHIGFPLRHPLQIVRNKNADQQAIGLICPWGISYPGYMYKLMRRIRNLFPTW